MGAILPHSAVLNGETLGYHLENVDAVVEVRVTLKQHAERFDTALSEADVHLTRASFIRRLLCQLGNFDVGEHFKNLQVFFVGAEDELLLIPKALHFFGHFFRFRPITVFFKLPYPVGRKNIAEDCAKVGDGFQYDVDVFGVRAHLEQIFKLAVPKRGKTDNFLRNRLDQTDFFSEG